MQLNRLPHYFSEIQELYETPARTDLTTISGYITYLEGLREGRIDLSSLQDTEEEGEEVFTVRLIQAKGGATLSGVDAVATITS
ncbi:hypothetical protein DPMN_060636 [Dreissena polymorpha]|uniref:Uncharacterized protein n=1 Tax=Dreissena polymorpha TaxID=45954 RepID=A0A9D4C6A0_DREPO|nr:hypothetical protein DPMN_060636 [Dreissena polymorpha]